MTRYVNLTPHEIVVRDPDGTTTAYPSTGTPARIAETVHDEDSVDGHRRVVVRLGELNGLPPYRPGVVHIVSMPCAMALAAARITRPDVVYPYELYRDAGGRTQGALALARIEVTS